jgi:phenylalanyl-tRNA synthetase alpha chain
MPEMEKKTASPENDLKNIILKLHPLERKVLPALKKANELSQIISLSKLQEVEVLRALQWLENKGILKINTEKKKIVLLDRNGELYKKEGLPEKVFLSVLEEEFKGLNVIKKKCHLSKEEIDACIGLLKRKAAIDLQKDPSSEFLQIRINQNGKKLREQPTLEEKFLAKTFPLNFDQIQDIDKYAFEELKKRKEFLKIEDFRKVTVSLTDLGKSLSQADLNAEVISRLTPQMLKTGRWKEQDFRAYDVEINVPKTSFGRIHFENQALDYIKRIWLDLGFREMTGNYVQSAFWDLDALFVPQDHPAREMQDTFYLDGSAKLPPLLKKIKEVHEHGGSTGSKGWRSSFSEKESSRILLRTHTTVLSAQTISRLKKEDLPVKYFAVSKVFRNEALDWKHLFEFYQVEGIVVDPNANLKHLKGYLREFYQKMGFTNIRMRPAHFPYTEPSLEVDVYHPVHKQWIELGGAGIFRPEVVIPLLGFDCPVLAWGQGMGRIIGEYWNLTDIRDINRNDLKQLREMKSWIR